MNMMNSVFDRLEQPRPPIPFDRSRDISVSQVGWRSAASGTASNQDTFIQAEKWVARRPSEWLEAALAELRDCVEEAHEEGYPEPTERALTVSEAILRRVANLPLRLPEPSVYPTADHEIAIFFSRNDVNAGVLITVDADGGGACFSNARGHRRARYGDISDLPDPFVKSELERLSGLARAV